MGFTERLRILTLCLSPWTMAADITTHIRSGTGQIDLNDGGYFALGINTNAYNRPLVAEDDDATSNPLKWQLGLNINGSYRYKGLFAEAEFGAKYINIGYNIWNNDHWTVDFLAASARGSISKDEDKTLTEQEQNKKLAWERTTWYVGSGLRITGYFNNYMLQYRLVTDVHHNNGITSTINFGKSWQKRNWNFHAIVGAEYTSAKTNNYWFGVSEDKATERFSAYKPDASIGLTAQVGVDYPISEKWVSSAFFRITQLPDEVNNSPIIQDSYDAIFVTSISYIF